MCLVIKLRFEAPGTRLWSPLILGLLAIATDCRPNAATRDLAFHRAWNAMEQGRNDWARFFFEADLETHPRRTASWRGLGIAHLSGDDGSVGEAIAAFREYLALNPENVEVQIRLARALHFMGQWEEALAIALPLQQQPEAKLLLAKIYLDRNAERALPWIEEALDSHANGFPVHLVAAKIYFELEDLDKTKFQLQKAMASDSLQPQPYFLQARVWQMEKAGEKARQALEIYTTLQKLFPKGKSSARSSWEQLRILRSLEPNILRDNVPFLKFKARLLLETGAIEEADPLLEKLTSIPHVSEADWAMLGSTSLARRLIDPARRCFERALALNPDNFSARAGLAQLSLLDGDADTTSRMIARALEDHPRHAPFYYLAGLAAISRNQESEGLGFFESALHWAPWQANYRIAVADLFLARGERDQFRKVVSEAKGKDPIMEAYKQKHGLNDGETRTRW